MKEEAWRVLARFGGSTCGVGVIALSNACYAHAGAWARESFMGMKWYGDTAVVLEGAMDQVARLAEERCGL